MQKSFAIVVVCPICGKGKGGGFRSINHDKCSKALQEITQSKKKHTTTRRITEKSLNYFAVAP